MYDNDANVERILNQIRSRVHETAISENVLGNHSLSIKQRSCGLADALIILGVSDYFMDKVYQAITMSDVKLMTEVIEAWRGEAEPASLEDKVGGIKRCNHE